MDSEWRNQDMGFESQALRDLGVYDDQRGALLFELEDTQSGAIYPLETRSIARTSVGPAAPSLGLTQIVALLEITDPDTPEGDYDIYYQRKRRTSPSQTHPSTYGEDLGPRTHLDQTIHVLPKLSQGGFLGQFTELIDVFPNPDDDISQFGRWIYPSPTLMMVIPNKAGAASVRLDYRPDPDPAKVTIQGVFIDTWLEGDPATLSFENNETAGFVDIQWTNPKAKGASLGIVFALVDPFDPALGRVDPANLAADFSVTGTLYDVDGNPMAGQAVLTGVR
ncbi:MAG: hypothetical protein QNK05_16960 [Myxococcota bacterium]|nr:hypothetical protein [Myxococcota bacterium]